MRIFTNAHYDFIRWRWHAIGLSLLVILAGFGLIAQRGLPLGIDFSGGTIVILKFQKPTPESAVRAALDSVPGEEVVQAYGDPAQNQVMVRLPLMEGVEQGASLEQGAKRVIDAVRAANLGQIEVVQQELVGPVVGADLQRKGIYATIASILGITIYIALRFRPSFAVGAMAATLHDILVTLAFLVFFKYELSLNVIAAILAITGYSVNDTIVIFDRVRENSHLLRRESLTKIVNDSVNQTLSRTIITAGTTFLAVLSLYLFGGEVLNGFAFTMLVGIVSGTYSTIFIAAAVAIILSKAAPVRTAPAEAPSPSGTGSKARRKAKAS
jgi:preprotein translocase subunit SecF